MWSLKVRVVEPTTRRTADTRVKHAGWVYYHVTTSTLTAKGMRKRHPFVHCTCGPLLNKSTRLVCRDHWLKDERVKEFDRIKKQYPERIPVICEKAEKSDMPPISKKKYLAPSVCILVFIHWRTWLSVNLFMWYVRRLNFLLIKLFSSMWTASFLLHQLPCTKYMLCIKMMTVFFTSHIREKILSMCDKLV